MINAILASTSTIHGSDYLQYLDTQLAELFEKSDSILFIPYARPKGISLDAYTSIVKEAFKRIGKDVNGIHQFEDPAVAIENSKGIFVGGGNTFMLLHSLYHHKIIDVLKSCIRRGTPYLGTSAGTNICGLNIGTTNDMPVIHPPSFDAMGIINLNINPHYIEPDPKSTHMGETRDDRIREFIKFNSTPVIALKEGSYLRISNNKCKLKGAFKAKFFSQNGDLTYLFTEDEVAFHR